MLGTRPEAIKLAPVILAMRAQPDTFRVLVWVTGQHRELIVQALELFAIAPDADFALMQPDQSQTALVGSILLRLDTLIGRQRPDWILVQGDTSSALAGALAGFYAGIPVAHVEAGLRTYNLSAPFPEEGNRQIISRIAALCCTPTATASANLRQEQIAEKRIAQTGNTVVDAIRWIAQREPALPASLGPWLDAFAGKRWVLTTVHRRESFGATLEGMLRAIRALADDQELNLAFVLPVHPNPNVHATVFRILGGHPGIALLPPLSYAELAAVLAHCWIVLTDSGGLQEEGPSLHKPVLVLRDVTERPEGIDAGVAELVGTEPQRLIEGVRQLVADSGRYRRMQDGVNPYGDGHAAAAILRAIADTSRSSPAQTI